MLARKQPVVQGRAGAADMQIAGGGGGKTNAYVFHGTWYPFMSSMLKSLKNRQ